MAELGIFPKEMLEGSNFSLETIASKLTYFQEQLHLNHWQTKSYSEHKALGELYEYVQSFKDDVIEKLMGYMNKTIGVYKFETLSTPDSMFLVNDLQNWSYKLYEWAGSQKYCDVENMAQELSGQAAKTKYLLKLS